MYAPTPFQFLPPHNVQLIVNHIAESIRTGCITDRTNSKKYEKLLIPLLSVCHNFRDNVHSRFFRDCTLNLTSCEEKVSEAHITWPSSPQAPAYPTHHLAKTLKIELCAWDVYSGAALRMLSVLPCDGIVFPLVSKFSVVLRYSGKCEEYHDGDDGFPRNAVHNIGKFVRCIKQMAPAIGTVVITTHGKPKDSDGEGVSYFGDLLAQLYGIAAIAVFSDPHGELGHCVSIDHICNLVHLSSRVDFKTGQVLSLARRNAQTLRHLELELFSSTDTIGLFQGPNSGEYVNYPRLHTFKLKMVKKSQAIRGPVLGDTVPFPYLRRLYVGANYPFGDDVLFRGNSATLEYLSLALYQETVAILSTHCVFTPTSHPYLQCVNIIPLSSGTRNDFATSIEYLEYVMSIAPGASVRQIADMRSTRNAIVPALSVLGDYACIQVLSLPYTELTLWDIISLIKSLPLLSDLATKNSNLGELPLRVSTSDLPEYVRTNYTPMGKRLRCWHISYFWSYDTVEVVTVALLLALACPNFDYVAVDDYIRREKFMTAMQEKIGEPGFSQDAPRLRRLLSNA
ncbi:hypothetical protein H4R27_003076 [Coemansia aciculifera]|nr:hypothetical protein H4R27_003076 [Coemansia aciculifera]